jgi:hypothetical protein
MLALAGLPLSAQWLDVPPPDAPKTKDGKVDMTGPVPRRPDGKPDLTGPWRQKDYRYLENIGADLKPEEFPIQPWAAELTKRRTQAENPSVNCLPLGVLMSENMGYPFKILTASPKLMVFLYALQGMYRQVFLDGRRLDVDAYNPLWMGFSTGKWDGDTLVVDTVGNNDKTWLDNGGHPMSEALHLTESYHRVDSGHLEKTIRIDDPKVFTKPFTVHEHYEYTPEEVLEFVCEASHEYDAAHMRSNK